MSTIWWPPKKGDVATFVEGQANPLEYIEMFQHSNWQITTFWLTNHGTNDKSQHENRGKLFSQISFSLRIAAPTTNCSNMKIDTKIAAPTT
jgi:hypothetical protein